MIIEKLNEQDTFTATEKAIADYVLKHSFDVAKMTATELGIKTYTSKATVFRFCKKLSVESFEEFKRQLIIETTEHLRIHALLDEEPFQATSNLSDIVATLPSFYDNAISHTKLILDFNALERVIQHMQEAEIIDFYATGITVSCATATMFKLQSIGKLAAVHTTINEHYVVATQPKKIVAIILSFTGSNPTLVKTAKYLKQHGCYIVGIGGDETAIIKPFCDEYIQIYQKNLVLNFEMMTPYISMTYILDILFARLLVSDYQQQVTNALSFQKNDKKL